MSMMSSMSRMRGQEKGPGYTQTETILAESMQKFGRELGEESHFGELKTQNVPKQSNKQKKLDRLKYCFFHMLCTNTVVSFYSSKEAATPS